MPAGLRVPQDTLIARLARQARKRERALARLRKLRKKASDEIDRLLEFLDNSDLDPDLEETTDNEPSLGWSTGGLNNGHCGGIDDLEQEEGNDEPDHCDEPSLGALEGGHHTDQTRWGESNRSDREDDAAESGIGDQDGLDEQVPFRDWQGVGMV
jgi:hypothetical protein